jgi:hypothetical protein
VKRTLTLAAFARSLRGHPVTTVVTGVGATGGALGEGDGVGEGGAVGTTTELGSDARETPTTFVARTVTVYPVPLTRPKMVQDRPVEVHSAPPGDAEAT